MRRFYLFLLTISLAFVLLACSGGKDEVGTGSETEGGSEVEPQEEVVIRYGNWNLGTEEEDNIERRMIEAFEEVYPHIKIEIEESLQGGGDWNEKLSSLASANNMPDVFMQTDMSLGLANDWLYDLTELVKDDEDFANVSEIVKQTVTFNDRIVSLPFAQHILGYWVNKDLFNERNLDYPEFGVSVEDFVEAVKNVTDINNGVVGMEQVDQIVEWYPAALNPELGWFTFDGENYHLNSEEFIKAVNLANELQSNNYAYLSLSEEQKANFNSENGWEAWMNGEIGIKWDGSWAAQGFTENASFETDFIGIPGGRGAITIDIIGISKTTEHPEEAYLFAKWMSFGKEGFLKRLEIANEMGVPVNGVPINTDQEILEEYFANMSYPGILKAYQNLGNAIVEPMKTVPGYIQARWEGVTGVRVAEAENANIAQLINAFINGELKVEDYADQLNDLANNIYQGAKQAIE